MREKSNNPFQQALENTGGQVSFDEQEPGDVAAAIVEEERAESESVAAGEDLQLGKNLLMNGFHPVLRVMPESW